MYANTLSYQDTPQRASGFALVLVFHLFLGWLLLSGTASKGLQLLVKPLTAVVIQEVHIAPPPPPPRQPKPTPPRPADFIPPSESTVPVPSNFVLESAPVPAPQATTAPVAKAVEAPAAPAPAAEPAQVDMAIACPSQVAPEMPRKALVEGVQGVVKAQVLIADGAVREVTILSGPRIFYPAVKTAMLQYKCTSLRNAVTAIQEFNFRVQR